jgi:nicotinamide-nucleotide amidase
VIAYGSEVKFSVLGVARGPVITAECAAQMAAGVTQLTGADFAVAVTGAGGPGPEEGKPAGTVYIAVHGMAGSDVQEHHFSGSPADVVQETTLHALQMLCTAAQRGPQSPPQ